MDTHTSATASPPRGRYVVTSPEDAAISDAKVYDLLPYRWSQRRPFLSSVGRLDKATSGLLLLTDDGQLLHRIQSPSRSVWKVMHRGREGEERGDCFFV